MISALKSINLNDFDFRNIVVDLHDKTIWLMVLILSILLISFLINLLLSNSFLGRYWRIFVALGVILHELSHACLCLVTGAQITKMAFFEKEGGHVEHAESKLPLFGQILISMAPLFVGAIAIYFISNLIGIKVAPIYFDNLSFASLFNVLKGLISTLSLHSVYFWALLYLALSIAVTMTPSAKDVSNVALLMSVLALIIFAVYRFFRLDINFSAYVPEKLIVFLSTTVILLILALVLSMLIFVITKMLRIK
ncbi:MAG: M50 family metallopeptidase [Candidatus Berkelbacteria bacterium]